MSKAAREKYAVTIIPAGRDDRVARITDRSGNDIKLVFCRRTLAGAHGMELDEVIKHDLETMSAADFARKYGLPEDRPGKDVHT